MAHRAFGPYRDIVAEVQAEWSWWTFALGIELRIRPKGWDHVGAALEVKLAWFWLLLDIYSIHHAPELTEHDSGIL